jgi:glycosyltransferase involved in cell wall biosynthesis
MKVAYDHQIFSEQKYGGISRYFFEVATRIQSLGGYEVDILSPLFVNNYLTGGGFTRVWGKHLTSLPRPRRVIQKLNAAIVKWKLHHDPPDVVHETYYLRQKLALPKTKTVVTVYDMIHEKFPQFFPKKDTTSLFKRSAVQRADHVICISESTRSDLVEVLGVDRNRTSVVHLAPTPHREVRQPALTANGRPYIAYVGLRSGYKNFAGLIRAFGISNFLRNNFSIVCFGGGPFTEKERHVITMANIKMEHLSHVEGGDDVLATVYRDAAAFVYPSLYEGFGLPPLEAMAADCPVVSSQTSSLPEVCGNAAEYFDPYEPEAIAISLERVMNSEERRQELIRLGRIQIQKFSWDTCARQTAKIYEMVSQKG